jgi:hypothetical protein
MDRSAPSVIFQNLLELNQTLLTNENLFLITCSTSVKIYKKIKKKSVSIQFKGPNRTNRLSLLTS